MKYIAGIVLALPLVMLAAPYYDPYNPNPNNFDIQAARETAAEHRHNAMISSGNWFEESGRAAQAEDDAYRLDARRRENMRQSDHVGWHGYVTDDSPRLIILNEKESRKAFRKKQATTVQGNRTKDIRTINYRRRQSEEKQRADDFYEKWKAENARRKHLEE